MTRERVEQAIETAKHHVTITKAQADEMGVDWLTAPHPDYCAGCQALTTLSDALAESEKERERLRALLKHIEPELKHHPVAVSIHQALSPDSQEKRDGS